jgi:hypothetical protein
MEGEEARRQRASMLSCYLFVTLLVPILWNQFHWFAVSSMRFWFIRTPYHRYSWCNPLRFSLSFVISPLRLLPTIDRRLTNGFVLIGASLANGIITTRDVGGRGSTSGVVNDRQGRSGAVSMSKKGMCSQFRWFRFFLLVFPLVPHFSSFSLVHISFVHLYSFVYSFPILLRTLYVPRFLTEMFGVLSVFFSHWCGIESYKNIHFVLWFPFTSFLLSDHHVHCANPILLFV